MKIPDFFRSNYHCKTGRQSLFFMMYLEGDKQSCDIVPQKNRPQHHGLGDSEAMNSITAQNDVRSKCNTSSDTSHFFSIPNIPVKYYRIVYRGVVALLRDPHPMSKKSGAYVSYGEIIASTFETDTSKQLQSESSLMYSSSHPQQSGSKSLGQPLVITSSPPSVSPLPLAPSVSFQSNYFSPRSNEPFTLSIRVDDVLTGGYSVDATTTATSYTHKTPKRSNKANMSCSNNSASDLVSAESSSGSDDGCISDKDHYPNQSQHHGYLLQNSNGCLIAENIPSPPLPCQTGAFFYRVSSKTPLPILIGPCADAPVTRALALPGTMFEVSLRMGTVKYSSIDGSDAGNYDLEDGVVYLRLSHKRGWIADRRFVEFSLQRKENSCVYPRKSSAEDGGKTHSRVEIVMKEIVDKEVIEFVDLSNRNMRDDMSLGGTSISSASIATPASVVRSRRRQTWRRCQRGRTINDCRSDMVVKHIAKKAPPTTINNKQVCKLSSENSSYSQQVLISPTSELSDSSVGDSCRVPYEFNVGRAKQECGPSRCINTFARNTEVKKEKIKKETAESYIYLIRVMAPNGLKILDAPHFQVNNLIRGQVNHSVLPCKYSNSKIESSKSNVLLPSKKNPTSIFHTMHGSWHSDSLVNNGTRSWEFDASGKARVLTLGALFEASMRVERVGNFTPGSGLLKLVDNTGWAIVPTREELDLQHANYQEHVTTEKEVKKAFEEVGHAITVKDRESMWVRITHRTGVPIFYPPTSNQCDGEVLSRCSSLAATSQSSTSTQSQSNHHTQGGSNSQELNTTLSTSSAFFGALRSARRYDSSGTHERGELSKSKQNIRGPLPNIIACGMCVEVEPWTLSKRQQEKQHYLRLLGNHGWIPRQIHGNIYSVKIERPKIRQGSFWFRVQVHGIKVRSGPSRRAKSIKSDDGIHFCFECGEFLRASQVLEINGHADMDDVFQKSCDTPSECFAKLYRNKFPKRHREGSDEDGTNGRLKLNPVALSSLQSQEEWVHVRCNNNVYLEESGHSPALKKNHLGWRYDVSVDSGVVVRKGPSFKAETIGTVLRRGDNVLINEQVTPFGEELSWLRLKDGRGWVHDTGEGEKVMTLHSSKKDSNTPYNGFIARLFKSELSNTTKKKV